MPDDRLTSRASCTSAFWTISISPYPCVIHFARDRPPTSPHVNPYWPAIHSNPPSHTPFFPTTSRQPTEGLLPVSPPSPAPFLPQPLSARSTLLSALLHLLRIRYMVTSPPCLSRPTKSRAPGSRPIRRHRNFPSGVILGILPNNSRVRRTLCG